MSGESSLLSEKGWLVWRSTRKYEFVTSFKEICRYILKKKDLDGKDVRNFENSLGVAGGMVSSSLSVGIGSAGKN